MTAKEIHHGLSYPSKMPGTSYGIPAMACLVGKALRQVPGTTCEDCYAFKGNYNLLNVKNAQERRLKALQDPLWVEAMIRSLKAAKGRKGWHRWHDSGDLQGLWHLEKIFQVAEGTPETKHWLPTREYGMVLAMVRSGRKVPKNLTIRLSDAFKDEKDSKAKKLAKALRMVSSGVHTKAQRGTFVCPAPKQENKCGECRACWNPKVKHVSYHVH